MRELLANALKEAGVEQKIEVEFIDLPAYSLISIWWSISSIKSGYRFYIISHLG
jgi:hypothetical protein